MRISALIAVCTISVALAGCMTPPVDSSIERDAVFAVTSSLVENPEGMGPGREAITWNWDDYASGNPPLLRDSGSFTNPVWVTDVQLDVEFQLSNVGRAEVDVRPFSRPPLTTWFGTQSGSTISHEFFEGPAVAAADSVLASWNIAVPEGGMYLAEGDALAVMVGSYYSYDEQVDGNSGVFIGIPESQLRVHLKPAPAMGARVDGGTDSVNVQGGACVVRDPSGLLDQQLREGAIQSISINVPEGTGFLSVKAETGFGDMDFWLTDANGNDVVHALGPGNTEQVLLGPDNLAGRGGEWTIHAYACSPTDGTINLEWILFDAVPLP